MRHETDTLKSCLFFSVGGSELSVASTPPRRLYRSNANRMIAGVCGGIAEYLNVDPTLVRLGFVLLVFVNGVGILLYLVIAIVTPRAPAGVLPPTPSGIPLDLSWLGPAILLFVGLGLVAFGAAWAFDQVAPWFWGFRNFWYIIRTLAWFFWSALLIAVGLVIVVVALKRR